MKLEDAHSMGFHRKYPRLRYIPYSMNTMLQAGTVKSSSRATVRLRQYTDCTTDNVVYLIFCSKFNKQYVGETKGPLNKRIHGHRDDWRHRRFIWSPTAEQFHCADHDFLSHASVSCLEHNKEWSDSTRKLHESYWIRRLNALCTFGINKGDWLFGHMVEHPGQRFTNNLSAKKILGLRTS